MTEVDHLANLRALATRSSAADITVPQVKEILHAGAETFWKPDAVVAAALAKVQAGLPLEKGEEVIKGYQIISHNAMGKEQERLLIMTTKALYRVNYLYKEKEVKTTDREPWSNIELIQFGKFYYNKGMLPSVGQIVLAEAINNLYGLRIFYKSKPDKAAIPLPFFTEKFVDECFRTYRPMGNAGIAAVENAVSNETDGKIGNKSLDFMEAVTKEMVFVALALHRHDLQSDQPYLQPYSDTQIAVNASRGIIVSIHNGLGMGLAADKAADGSSSDASAAPAEKTEKAS
jgi:hypothetical protein